MFRRARKPQPPLPGETPHAYLMLLLGRRDYSKHQLETKLRERGWGAEAIATSLRELEEQGLFRETMFTGARIRAFIQKGYGPNVIRQRLRQERVPFTEADIEKAYEHLGLSPRDQILELVRKNLKTKMRGGKSGDLAQLKRRVVNAIAVKGHSPHEAAKELDLALRTTTPDGSGPA